MLFRSEEAALWREVPADPRPPSHAPSAPAGGSDLRSFDNLTLGGKKKEAPRPPAAKPPEDDGKDLDLPLIS